MGGAGDKMSLNSFKLRGGKNYLRCKINLKTKRKNQKGRKRLKIINLIFLMKKRRTWGRAGCGTLIGIILRGGRGLSFGGLSSRSRSRCGDDCGSWHLLSFCRFYCDRSWNCSWCCNYGWCCSKRRCFHSRSSHNRGSYNRSSHNGASFNRNRCSRARIN